MKKVTTTIIAIGIVIILIITGRIIFSNGQHIMSANTPDESVKNFLEMMIPHHTEAVDTSKVIMMDQDITVTEVRLLAARIADAQEFEITQMKGWYMDWFGAEYEFDPSMYQPMMTSVDEDAKGDVRAELWLKDMIAHHEHAVQAAKQTREQIAGLMKDLSTSDGTLTLTNSHPGIDMTLLFAEHVETAQEKEIEEMKALLEKF